MAVKFLIGFETSQLIAESGAGTTSYLSLTGTAGAYSTTQVRTGTYAYRMNPASGAAANLATLFAGLDGYVHFGLYVATLPSVDRQIFSSYSAGTMGNRLDLTSAGALKVYSGGSLQGTSSAAFATPGWHWVGMRLASGYSTLRIDNIVEVDVAGGNGISGGMRLGPMGTEASAIDLYVDDFMFETTGFLAPSKVALLKPISDSSISTWTGGAGGTTNLWDAVDNTPPAGLATETNTSQIEHPGGGALNETYYANMTTYATAGIVTGDTVLAVHGLFICGEDSATGTKLLSYAGYSNPVWTGEYSFDVSAGEGTGATLDYAGTTADKWNEHWGTIADSPSVTLDTSPVMYVSRPETASRVASVCFMGMYVAWTPAAASRVPFTSSYPQLLAQ